MVNDPDESRRILVSIARRVNHDPSLHEDLVQEASVHLWLRLERHPGQRPSWYCQSCFEHLRNYLRRGRSVDSFRHRRSIAGGGDPAWSSTDLSFSNDDVLADVCAQDLMEELSKWLTPDEQRTLVCLAEGLSLRETAVHFKISHTTINKHRRAIQALAIKLAQPRLMTSGGEVRGDSSSSDHLGIIKYENGRMQKAVF